MCKYLFVFLSKLYKIFDMYLCDCDVDVCLHCQALQTATLYDRIHLRTTNYNYAKYLESRGQIDEAIKLYAVCLCLSTTSSRP